MTDNSNFYDKFADMQDYERAQRMRENDDVYTRVADSYGLQTYETFADVLHRWKDNAPYSRQDAIFDLLWTSPQLRGVQEEQVRLTLCELSEAGRAHALSALGLALLEYFDPAKLRLLLEYCNDEVTPREQARALLGVVIACHRHPDLLQLFPQLMQKVRQTLSPKQLQLVQHDVACALRSEQLQKKMHEEIMPLFLKWGAEQMRNGMEESEYTSMDSFIDSLDEGQQRDFRQHMHDMQAMLMDGVDMNLSSVRLLKLFPFFSRPCHWLAPFEQERPEASSNPLICMSHMCDSDKYSMSCIGSFSNSEVDADEVNHMQPPASLQAFVRFAVQDHYRLLLHSIWRKEFPKFFGTEVLLIDNAVLAPVVSDNSRYLSETGATLLRHHRHADALRHLQLLAQTAGSSADTLCKTAICHKALGRLPQAISCLRQADILSEDNTDVLDLLQDCLEAAGQHAQRADVLMQLEQLAPDNTQITLASARCLMSLERWEEAKKRWFKLEFLNQYPDEAMQGIATCADRLGATATAEKYRRKMNVE